MLKGTETGIRCTNFFFFFLVGTTFLRNAQRDRVDLGQLSSLSALNYPTRQCKKPLQLPNATIRVSRKETEAQGGLLTCEARRRQGRGGTLELRAQTAFLPTLSTLVLEIFQELTRRIIKGTRRLSC